MGSNTHNLELLDFVLGYLNEGINLSLNSSASYSLEDIKRIVSELLSEAEIEAGSQLPHRNLFIRDYSKSVFEEIMTLVKISTTFSRIFFGSLRPFKNHKTIQSNILLTFSFIDENFSKHLIDVKSDFCASNINAKFSLKVSKYEYIHSWE